MPTTPPTSVRLTEPTLEQLDELRELMLTSDPAPWNGQLPTRTAAISYAIHTARKTLSRRTKRP